MSETAPELPLDLSPEDAFAEHVSHIRANGDALDTVAPIYSPKPKVAVNMMTGAASGSIGTIGLTGDLKLGLPVFLAAAIPPVVSVLRYGRRVKNAWIQVEDRMAPEVSRALGERYELFRITDEKAGRSEVAMAWYGHILEEGEDDGEEASAADSLRRMAGLARDNDIRAVFVHSDTLDDLSDKGRLFAGGETDAAAWVGRAKKVDVVVRDDKNQPATNAMLAFTPQKLTAFAEFIDNRNLHMPGLDNVINTLRRRMPQHPLVGKYDEYQIDTKLQLKVVGKTAKACLEYPLHDVVMDRDQSQTEVPVRKKVHLQGSVGGKSVRWHNAGLHHSQADFFSAVGMDVNRMHKVLASPDTHSDRDVRLAAECAAFGYSQGWFVDTKQERSEIPLYSRRYSMQDQIGQSFRTQRPARFNALGAEPSYVKPKFSVAIRYLSALAFATAACCGSYAVDERYTDLKENSERAAESDLAAAYGVTLDDLTEDDREFARERAISNLPASLQLYGQVREPTQDGLEAVDSLAFDALDFIFTGSAFGQSSVGAAENPRESRYSNLADQANRKSEEEDPKNVWQIRPSEGMGTKGYWSLAVQHELLLDGTWDGGHESYASVMNIQDIPAEVNPEEHPYIHVSRDIPDGPADMIFGTDRYRDILTIPVLEGTRPVAGTMNGRNLQAITLEDGSYVLSETDPGLWDGQEGGELNYWLVPSETATRPLAPYRGSLVQAGTSKDTVERHEVRTAWERAVPGLPPSGPKRYERQRDYVKSNFTYTLSPLSDRMMGRLRAIDVDWSQLTEEQLQTQLADCDVANTLIALDNPELNHVTGYFNDGDFRLASDEKHAWLVDSDGRRIDATPPGIGEVETLLQQQEGQESRGLPVYEILGGAAALAVLGATQRKRIMDGYARTKRWQARTVLNRKSADDLQTAVSLAEMAGYAARVDISKIKPADAAAPELLKKLARPSLHTGIVDTGLQRARSEALGTDRALVVQSEKTVRLVRRAGMVVLPDREPKGIEDLLFVRSDKVSSSTRKAE